MSKKLTLLVLAVGIAAAFAAPAAAQADELYEKVGGVNVRLEEGAAVTATSTNTKFTSPLGTLECQKVTFHGELVENSGSIFIEEISTIVEGCNKTITNPSIGDIHLSGGSGVATGWSGLFSCVCLYTGDVPVKYDTDTDVLTVTGSSQLAGSPTSPCGNLTLHGSFTLETSDGTPVFMS